MSDPSGRRPPKLEKALPPTPSVEVEEEDSPPAWSRRVELDLDSEEDDFDDVKSDPSKSPIDFSSFSMKGKGLSSLARLNVDGRIAVDLALAKSLPDLPNGYAPEVEEDGVEVERTDLSGGARFGGVPKLSILICIVGSRGDVQPYLALSLALVAHGHRVRLATHGEFKTFIQGASKGQVEFFDLGGDPRDLLSYCVKNPGLMPGFESLTNGDIGKKKKMLKEIMKGCWQASFYPDVTSGRGFAADAIISNPPAFAHVHLAEALGLPLQMTFTMPWSATTEFHHPLVQINTSNAPKGMTNYLSFALADMMTWQGLSGITNSFRKKVLGLEPLSALSGPSVVDRLKLPWTYCWSQGLIPKPSDWKQNTDISGFYFLDLASDYEPPPDLAAFLAAGPPPIYIGFGSVPVKDPEGMTRTIFDAVRTSNVRALVSAGWGGLGGEEIPEGVFILGNVPHDWLFTKVFAVCHHGGAGTTAAGLLNGRPTIVVPFFGDQEFWGEMVAKAGGGPPPIHSKKLTSELLVEAINFCMTSEAQTAARKMGDQIRAENGVEAGVESFYRHLPLTRMRCELDPSRVAVWWSSDLCLRLSAFAAQVLADAGKLKLNRLIPHRAKEYDTKRKATDPISGGAAAALAAVTDFYLGVGTILFNPAKGAINTATALPIGVYHILEAMRDGFSNLPGMYGSDVRTPGKVTGIGTGLKEAAKGYAYGTYDGFVGLVMKPIEGGQKDGAVGALKGAGIGLLDFAVKPFTGLFAAVTYPVDGAVKSIKEAQRRKLFASNNSTRITEGLEAVENSTPDDRQRLLETFALTDETTSERRKEYHDWARRTIDKWEASRKKEKEEKKERKKAKGKGKGREDESSLASTDQEDWESYGRSSDSQSVASSSRTGGPGGLRGAWEGSDTNLAGRMKHHLRLSELDAIQGKEEEERR
ncbi:hypothetical protein BDY24DRAFT_397194 [Mrakia frigida]|uniref:uncharacterized protein n=1 Tax=Mrakia frigida TaxID=29902 RepID=UPI003FCC1155